MFKNHMTNVATSKAKKYLIGYNGEKETVLNIGRTLSEIILAPTRRTVIGGEFEANDYELPTGTGLMELANVGRVYLFEDVVAIAKALPAKPTDCIVAQWKTECLEGKILSPNGLKSVLSEFYGYLGESKGFQNVTKEDKTLESFQHLYEREGFVTRINHGDKSADVDLVAYYLKIGHPFFTEYGRTGLPVVREDLQSEWLFGAAAPQIGGSSKKDEAPKEEVVEGKD
jgi:hypothetical protein